jgi:anti-sigma regulatory factor (Ser/Thr protein kinase)
VQIEVTGFIGSRIALAAQPASVAAARRFVRTTVADVVGDHALLDDAVLIVSELVANAVLHARGLVAVAVEVAPGPPVAYRIEVADDSPSAPAVRDYGEGASTGRGLAVIARLATRWGIVPVEPSGKAVWVELVDDDTRAAGEATDPESTLAPAPSDGDRPGARPVAFLGVPVVDYLRLQEQNDAVFRELELLAFTADHAGDVDPSPDLVAVIERARAFSNQSRDRFRQEIQEALARGDEIVDFHRLTDPSGLAPAAEFVDLFESAEELAARGELLVAPPDDTVRRLRRWFVAEMSRQLLEELPPEPFAQPPEGSAR